jgi:hypothetical protein
MKGGIVTIEGKAVIDLGQYRSIRRTEGAIHGSILGGKKTDIEVLFEGSEEEVTAVMHKIEKAVSDLPQPPAPPRPPGIGAA